MRHCFLGTLFDRPELRAQIKHIQKAVSLKEHRYITRVLRSLASTRKKVSDGLVLRKLILQTLPDGKL